MTSGLTARPPDRLARRALAALALACGLVLAPGAIAADWTVARLMDLLARSKPGLATFNETKFIALLDRPVESSGELRFTPPRRLEKRTLAPGSETLVADGDSLTMERHGKRHTLAMRDHPEVAPFIDSIRGTLAGDRASLERAFTLASRATSRAGPSFCARARRRRPSSSRASKWGEAGPKCSASRSPRPTVTAR